MFCKPSNSHPKWETILMKPKVFLNDLPGNDFNIMSLPSLYEKINKDKGSDFGPCFKTGMLGNFYGRLFPNTFAHSSHIFNNVHRLAIPKVPEGLVNEKGSPFNEWSIYLSRAGRGLIEEAKLGRFNLPYHTASAEEVRRVDWLASMGNVHRKKKDEDEEEGGEREKKKEKKKEGRVRIVKLKSQEDQNLTPHFTTERGKHYPVMQLVHGSSTDEN
ncbi:unnamed protein product [Dovyalis caffra]|uniref:Uncharacterized protein n=1 Tax=Dovyalis caffra TaxID=77055 RepID=A0AAV1R6X1_9ROSI|nr:unnamed protein product [Dovyalis caffra]